MHSSIPRNHSNRGAGHGPARRAAVSVARVAALAALIFLTGCPAMSSPQEAGVELAVKIDTSKPIRFSNHDFGAACFDTWGCRVRYNGFLHVDDSDSRKSRATSEFGRDYLNQLSAGYIGVRNFPAPAELEWRSKDRTSHHATIDLGEIFADQVVLHRISAGQLPPFLFSPVVPEILLVIDDRTVSIYMKAHIATKGLQDPDNRYSGFRNDLLLAYSKTY